MKKILAAIVLFALAGCSDQKQKTVTIDNLEQASLDVVYGFQASIINGENINKSVQTLQLIMLAWPLERQTNKEDCYMQLKNETVRALNLIDKLPTDDHEDIPDYRWECRQRIQYQYDKSRIDSLWNSLKS